MEIAQITNCASQLNKPPGETARLLITPLLHFETHLPITGLIADHVPHRHSLDAAGLRHTIHELVDNGRSFGTGIELAKELPVTPAIQPNRPDAVGCITLTMSGEMTGIVQTNNHAPVCAGYRRLLSAEAVLNNFSLIRQTRDAGSNFELLHIATRHGPVDRCASASARGTYRVPPQGVTP